MKKHISALALALVVACSPEKPIASPRPSSWAQKIEVAGFSNLYKVDADLYRAEQPHANEMAELKTLGIKTVLNLRQIKNDNSEAKGKNLNLVHEPINAWTISYEEVVQAVKDILKAEKPVLVHCKHGADRTGCVVAAYRLVQCGWTKEEALNEFLQGGFGFHNKWFPNMVKLVKSFDAEKLKKDVGVK